MSVRLCIDADSLKYKVGQPRIRSTVAQDDGSFLCWYPENPHYLFEDNYLKEHVIVPLVNQIQELDREINAIIAAADASQVEVVLTQVDSEKKQKRNFRIGIASIAPYKGNRIDAKRPLHDKALHDHLIKNWNAIEMKDLEADDYCCIRGAEGFLVAAIDKDVLYSAPGLKYNYRTQEFFEVSDLEAFKFFCKQLLMGDPIDNIQGLYRVGEKIADKILDAVKDKDSKQAYYDAVIAAYQERFKGEHPLRLCDRIHETASLLWMKQTLDDAYTKHINPWKVEELA